MLNALIAQKIYLRKINLQEEADILKRSEGTAFIALPEGLDMGKPFSEWIQYSLTLRRIQGYLP